MMDLLLIGGINPHNKSWLHEVAQTLAPLFNSTIVHEHAHWASAAPQIDLEHELEAVHREARDLDNYAIFAKSAGAIVAIKGIAQKTLRPKACLFVGLPLAFVRQHGHQLDVWLQGLDMTVIFAQNAHDPAGSYKEVDNYLREHMHSPHYKTVELPGDTHEYSDFARIKELVAALLAD